MPIARPGQHQVNISQGSRAPAVGGPSVGGVPNIAQLPMNINMNQFSLLSAEQKRVILAQMQAQRAHLMATGNAQQQPSQQQQSQPGLQQSQQLSQQASQPQQQSPHQIPGQAQLQAMGQQSVTSPHPQLHPQSSPQPHSSPLHSGQGQVSPPRHGTPAGMMQMAGPIARPVMPQHPQVPRPGSSLPAAQQARPPSSQPNTQAQAQMPRQVATTPQQQAAMHQAFFQNAGMTQEQLKRLYQQNPLYWVRRSALIVGRWMLTCIKAAGECTKYCDTQLCCGANGLSWDGTAAASNASTSGSWAIECIASTRPVQWLVIYVFNSL